MSMNAEPLEQLNSIRGQDVGASRPLFLMSPAGRRHFSDAVLGQGRRLVK